LFSLYNNELRNLAGSDFKKALISALTTTELLTKPDDLALLSKSTFDTFLLTNSFLISVVKR